MERAVTGEDTVIAERAAAHESTGSAERAVTAESTSAPEQGLEAVERLSRDIRAAARLLRPDEARYFVSTYYEVQEQRIRAAAQVRASQEAGEPNELLVYAERQYASLERNAKNALQAYAEEHEVGRWSLSITGIGPVIAAGLLAHIDIGKAPTVGHIWRFAGLDPTLRWNKGEKRPWNAALKTLCWKVGESFVKTSGHKDEIYGSVYRERKEREIARNEAGDFAEQAAQSLAEKKFRTDTVARQWYDQGKLPPARIHLRAQRYAVKLFLSHWHHVAYEAEFGTPPPKPYVLTQLDHAHYVAPPNWP